MLKQLVHRIIVTPKNVNGQLGPSGQIVLRSVEEVEATDLDSVGKKTNALEIVMREKIATKKTVNGQLGPGPSGQIVVKFTDIVQNRTDVKETPKKKPFRIANQVNLNVRRHKDTFYLNFLWNHNNLSVGLWHLLYGNIVLFLKTKRTHPRR